MKLYDGQGKPLRFSSAAAQRKWSLAHSGAVASAARAGPTAAVSERVAIKALILAVEEVLGSPILDDGGGERFLKSARRRNLSQDVVIRELARLFCQITMKEVATR
jgi:hypothetical protein